MADIEDFALGSDGKWYSPNGPRPPGVTLNHNPTKFATPPPGNSGFATSQGGPVATRPITTPDSSSGRPRFQAPSATTLDKPVTNPFRTPLSSTGTPSSGPRYVAPNEPNPMTMPAGGALATGVAALERFPTPSPEEMERRLNNPPMADDPWGVHAISKLLGWGQPATQTQPQTATAPPDGSPTQTTAPPPPIDIPPMNVPPPPPSRLPPFVRGPIPFNMPDKTARAPSAQGPGAPNLGYGTPQAAPQAPSPMFTTIDRPNADISGGRSVAGQLAPQYFNQAREPGGPAQMGALDLSSIFSHPAVAQAAAAHPAVQGALAAQAGGGWQGAVGAPNMDDAQLGQQIIGNGWSPSGNGRGAPPPQATARGFNPFALFGTPT